MRREVKAIKVLCIFNKQNIAKSAVVKCRTSAMLSRYGQVLRTTLRKVQIFIVLDLLETNFSNFIYKS